MLLITLLLAWLPAAMPPTDAILAEGLRLYQSERSSWVATDLMVASSIDPSEIGGYLSYFRGDSVSTIFWAKNSAGTAGSPWLARYTFPRQDVRAETSACQRVGNFTADEARLYGVRQTALAELNTPSKGYSVPAKSSLNLALVEEQHTTRVYMLTGAQEAGVLPIGNDYLLTFAGGKLQSTERLHNSYLPMRRDATQKEITTVMHTHLPAHPYITPTDICAVLLYQDAVPAQQCLVMSKDYVSIFDMRAQKLVILTSKAFEKITRDGQK